MNQTTRSILTLVSTVALYAVVVVSVFSTTGETAAILAAVSFAFGFAFGETLSRRLTGKR